MPLRTQLLLAVSAGLALGCTKPRPTIEPANEPAPADATPPVTTTATATPPETRACSADTKRETYCLAVKTSPPTQIPNPSPNFDANGCAPVSAVQDHCNGVHDVLSGPELRGKECCYVVCRGLVAPCGRLLLNDEGEAIVASCAFDTGWTDHAFTLPEAARDAWLVDALLEHASVAAFARFSLELLAIGAPARFVEDAHRAALDEIEHARLCSALASTPESLRGPGPLESVRVRQGVAEVVLAAAEECCCGETFAALVAQHALAVATHPGARRALERIAVDEAKHAELGWRFVAWAVARFGEVARDAAFIGIERGLARLAAATVVSADDLEAYGRLPAAVVRAVAIEASVDLIQPLRDELKVPAPRVTAPGARAR